MNSQRTSVSELKFLKANIYTDSTVEKFDSREKCETVFQTRLFI